MEVWETFPIFYLAKSIEILPISPVIRNDIHADFLNHTQLLLRPTKATGLLTKPASFHQALEKTELSRRIGAAWRVFSRGALAGACE